MKKFTKSYAHHYNAHAGTVFPLLCPVRESDWLHDWTCKIIHSKSGLVEKGCVFKTGGGPEETTWVVTTHDTDQFLVEFVRMTPGKVVVELSIQLTEASSNSCIAAINYMYTPLSKAHEQQLEATLDQEFELMMKWWEKAMNYYLANKQPLLPES